MTGLPTDAYWMRLAIASARRGVQKGQTPFGACIVREGEVLACEHNSVWLTTDITAHAEINAIRTACRQLGKIDLSGATIFSSVEPCPMCFSAIHWAKVTRIVFGADIEDAKKAGFNELSISNAKMKTAGDSDIVIESGLLRTECQSVFDEWLERSDRRPY
jgi:tRNA(Arg) A34 adenosine deaminase TadA